MSQDGTGDLCPLPHWGATIEYDIVPGSVVGQNTVQKGKRITVEGSSLSTSVLQKGLRVYIPLWRKIHSTEVFLK